MNVSSSITMNYEQRTMNYDNKNKPNQTQSQDPTPKHPLICTKSREISGITGFIATKASAFAKATADRLRHEEKSAIRLGRTKAPNTEGTEDSIIFNHGLRGFHGW